MALIGGIETEEGIASQREARYGRSYLDGVWLSCCSVVYRRDIETIKTCWSTGIIPTTGNPEMTMLVCHDMMQIWSNINVLYEAHLRR